MRAVWDAAYGTRSPDFRKAPFDLGSFLEIVYGRGGREDNSRSFVIGFKEQVLGDRLLDYDAMFEPRDAAPAPATIVWRTGAVSVESRYGNGAASSLVFTSPGWSLRLPDSDDSRLFEGTWTTRLLSRLGVADASNDPSSLARILKALPTSSEHLPNSVDIRAFSFLADMFTRVPSQNTPFASAPTQSSPRRTYDPIKLSDDPWGADVPSRLASLEFQGKTEWTALKNRLDAFGQESGLFDDFSVKQLTKFEGGPFQLQVRKFGKGGRKGRKRNLMDVGFGVSQVLPVLAALFRAGGPTMFLLQQPELHLHPSAQAALGSLFCRTAEGGRQLIIETHSEYIIDRVRMDIRDRETALTPDDVSILFFERSDLDVRIHSLQFDEQGNVLGAPDGYGQFFMDETRRSVGL